MRVNTTPTDAQQPECSSSERDRYSNCVVSDNPFGVVLLHGLSMTTAEMQPIRDYLYEHYKNRVVFMEPTFREGIWSCWHTLENQEAALYAYVQNEIRNVLADVYYKCNRESITNEQIRKFPLYIIGNSQGGELATIFVAKRHQVLNILGLVSHDGTLLGANLLGCTRNDINTFHIMGKQGIEAITYLASKNTKEMIGVVKTCAPLLLAATRVFPNGVRDTAPNNACTRSTYNFLRKEAHQVPCLLIGGFQNDLGELFPNSIKAYKNVRHDDPLVDQSISELNRAHAKLLTGSENDLHDQLIPLKTQLCRGDSLDDLTEALKNMGEEAYHISMPNRDHVECVAFKGITHCANLMSLAPSLFMENKASHESMLRPHRMLPILREFIDKQLRLKRHSS